MTNVKDILDEAKNELIKVGIESASLDVMILLEAVSGKDRSWLLAHGGDEVFDDVIIAFKSLVDRRIKREPIAQIIGGREFYGRQFLVSKDVLAPRPETEILVETALKYARYCKPSTALSSRHPPHKITAPPTCNDGELKLLDLGTGSGCILLTLLLELPQATGTGIDASTNALAIAAKNAYNWNVKTARFIHSNWCENLEERHFNLIVSNPPYIAKGDKPKLDAELGYEPEMALFGGDDGLECYRAIALEISQLSFDFAIFEIGINQEIEIEKIFGDSPNGYQIKLIETVQDYAGINRVLVFKR